MQPYMISDYILQAAGYTGASQPTGPDLSKRRRTFAEKAEIIRYFQMKRSKRMKTPEEIFKIPIKLGIMKIERRRGKGPKVVWL